MTLTYKILKELESADPDLLENIQTFTNMKIPKELYVTDPDAYTDQTTRLEILHEINTRDLKKFIETHIDNVVDEIQKELSIQDTRADTSNNGYTHFNWDNTTGNHSHTIHT